MLNVFKVNNKDIRATPIAADRILLLILHI